MSAGVARIRDRAGPLPARRAYDVAAPFYDTWRWQDFWRGIEAPLVMGAVQGWIEGRRQPRILDVGCGTGWYLEHLGADAAATAGVDISLGMISRARARLPVTDLMQADARALPFGDATFDIAISTRVLSHIGEVDLALGEVGRVLKPGGVAILTNVDAHYDYDQTRLPAARGQVVADTYKHPRELIAGLLSKAGLRCRETAFIPPEGRPFRVARLAQDPYARIVAWMSVWSRPD